MKYKIYCTIKGNIARPSYDGTISIQSNDSSPDFEYLVAQKLRRTSFPDACASDIQIDRIEVDLSHK